MKHDRRRSHEPKLCDRIHADDGVEAEELFFSRRKFDRSGDRKTRQLCKVVQRALGAALAGDCRDDLLRELVIQSVDPAPSASRLRVMVYLPGNAAVPVGQVRQRLENAMGLLRWQVAAAVVRRRAPELVFQVVADPGAADDRGEEVRP